MRRLGRYMIYLLGLLVLIVAVAAAAIWFEPTPRPPAIDATAIGDDPEAYLHEVEARAEGVTPGTERRIVWAAEKGRKTPVAIVYLHGFSATSEEIRPVPDMVARALGANLYFARLTGHGQSGEALAAASVEDWLRDLAEAVEIGRRIGDEVIIMSTSTGGALAALGATWPGFYDRVKGIIFVSPNFRVKDPKARILDWPLVRYWAPIVAGRERAFETRNAAHAKYWTSRYPTVALVPMARLARLARRADYSGVKIPALFIFSPDDIVVDAAETERIAASWGGPVRIERRHVGPGDDPNSHVIAGDIMSPSQTRPVAEIMIDWARGL
ncbi:MAG: alpha/beta hydrolase [Alphaproteobacteria bacterium]|nr:MAG: alpha/beta hydrolase [Alphaproteobacteria bacterium]